MTEHPHPDRCGAQRARPDLVVPRVRRAGAAAHATRRRDPGAARALDRARPRARLRRRACRWNWVTARTGSPSASTRSKSRGRSETPTPSRMRSTRSGAASRGEDGSTTGSTILRRALDIALGAGHGHLAGRAYANLASVLADTHRYRRRDAVLAEGLRYTDDHDLTLRFVCLTGVLAGAEMERGRWDDALADATGMLERTGTMTVGRIPALTVIGTIAMRRGDDSAHAMLLEARRYAEDAGGGPRAGAQRTGVGGGSVACPRPCPRPVDRRQRRSAEASRLDPHELGALMSWRARLGPPARGDAQCSAGVRAADRATLARRRGRLGGGRAARTTGRWRCSRSARPLP